MKASISPPRCATGSHSGTSAHDVAFFVGGVSVHQPPQSFDLPGGEWRRIQKSKGYNWILVNGEITFEGGEPTGALPGRFLRNGRG